MLCEECQERPAAFWTTRKDASGIGNRQLCRVCAEPLLHAIDSSYEATDPRASAEIVGATFLTQEGAGADSLPAETALPDGITVSELAAVLHLHPYQIAASLLRINPSISLAGNLAFADAAALCDRIGVAPIQAQGKPSALPG